VSELRFVHLGFGPEAVEYRQAWEEQRRVHAARFADEIPDTCLMLEHPPVYTAGRRTVDSERPVDGTPVVDVDRGGKITWHGPGQLVGYPILKLPRPVDVVAHVRRLEEALIRACAEFGLETTRVEGRSGVWVLGDPLVPGPPPNSAALGGLDLRLAPAVTTGSPAGSTGGAPASVLGPPPGRRPGEGEEVGPSSPRAGEEVGPSSPRAGEEGEYDPRMAGPQYAPSNAGERGADRKLAALGIRVAKGVTMHGFALNCDPDNTWFDRIVPCGIRDAGVTSLSNELGRAVTVAEALPVVERHLAAVLAEAQPRPRPLEAVN
jgi:lipoyl(octanoyl) transferase